MSGRDPLKEQILAALDGGSTIAETARKLGCPAERVRAIRAARRARARVIADTEARLERAEARLERAEGALVTVSLPDQGVVVEDWHDRKGFSEYGAPLSEGRGRPPMTSEQIRAVLALARQPEFRLPNGKPNKYGIAKALGWNERSVGRALEYR